MKIFKIAQFSIWIVSFLLAFVLGGSTMFAATYNANRSFDIMLCEATSFVNDFMAGEAGVGKTAQTGQFAGVVNILGALQTTSYDL